MIKLRKFPRPNGRFKLHPKAKGHLRNHPYVIPVFGLLFGFLIVAAAFIALGGQTYAPSDSHVVNLSVNGQQKVLPTKAKTVGELVKKLNIDLIPEDIIEPSPNTSIDQDNFYITVYRARPVLVVDGATKVATLSAERSPRVAAVKAGLAVYPEDKAEFVQGDIKQGVLGEKVEISRATAVNFNLYGTPLVLRTQAKTVGELLKEKNIKPLDGDTLQPLGTTPVMPGMMIFLVHNGKQVVTEEQVVPPPVEYQDDPSLSIGQNIVRDPGIPGKKAVTYELTIENGKETSRRVIQEVTESAPVRQMIARGTRPKVVVYIGDKSGLMAAAGISANDYTYVDYIIGHESGWCATKWQGQVGYCPPSYEQIHSISALIGYGLCQSTPPIKMASMGADWATNPVTQLRWCSDYAITRYGSWYGAYSHWLAYHNW